MGAIIPAVVPAVVMGLIAPLVADLYGRMITKSKVSILSRSGREVSSALPEPLKERVDSPSEYYLTGYTAAVVSEASIIGVLVVTILLGRLLFG